VARPAGEELAKEAAAQEEMARDHCRWDEDMATAKRTREIRKLASQHRHHRNLARRQAIRARQTDGEGLVVRCCCRIIIYVTAQLVNPKRRL
jgi:hypothetical protein